MIGAPEYFWSSKVSEVSDEAGRGGVNLIGLSRPHMGFWTLC